MTPRGAEAERIQLAPTLSPSPQPSPFNRVNTLTITHQHHPYTPPPLRHHQHDLVAFCLDSSDILGWGSPPACSLLRTPTFSIQSLLHTRTDQSKVSHRPPPTHALSLPPAITILSPQQPQHHPPTQSQHAPATPPPPHQHHPTTPSHVHHSRMGFPSRLLSPPHPDLPHPLPLHPCLPPPPTAFLLLPHHTFILHRLLLIPPLSSPPLSSIGRSSTRERQLRCESLSRWHYQSLGTPYFVSLFCQTTTAWLNA